MGRLTTSATAVFGKLEQAFKSKTFCPVFLIKNWTFVYLCENFILVQTTDYIQLKIARFPKGYVFTYDDFITEVSKKEAIIKGLNRMVASGKINKLSKGKYYKPEPTVFGTLLPQQFQVVKDLLEKDGKLIGYITGYSIYNQLGLTTQISNTIQIGKNEVRPAIKRGIYKIAFIRQKNTITKENIALLQILDAIRYIRKIPDTDTASACKRFLAIIKDIKEKDITTIVRLAQKYPQSTRALLGALLEQTGTTAAGPLKKSLNPITMYKLSGANRILSFAENWNIKS